MKRFYFKSAVISTLLSSNVALAGGSEQNSFGDLFVPEFPHFAQSTPAIENQLPVSDCIDSENFYFIKINFL
jgi:hypothetical protein